MATYYISTDGEHMEIRARSVRQALREFGAPAEVTTSQRFTRWLEQAGGYGFIERDGEVIALVKS